MWDVTEEFAFDPFFEGSFSEATVLGDFYSFSCGETDREFIVYAPLLFCEFSKRTWWELFVGFVGAGDEVVT